MTQAGFFCLSSGVEVEKLVELGEKGELRAIFQVCMCNSVAVCAGFEEISAASKPAPPPKKKKLLPWPKEQGEEEESDVRCRVLAFPVKILTVLSAHLTKHGISVMR
jgi:hypothetical protein